MMRGTTAAAAVLTAAFGLATALCPATARAAEAPLPVELNKLEPVTQGGAGCRVYLLVTNPDAEAIDQLRLDLILFGTDGVIARRVAVDLAPLPAKKQAVRLFDLTGLPCDDIGRVLVNDVIACARHGQPVQDADRAACLDRLALTSRAKAQFAK